MALHTIEPWIPEAWEGPVVQKIMQDSVVEAIGRPEPMTTATKHVPRSGGMGLDVLGKGDMKAQVHAVYTDLKQTLAAHGATFVHVVKENVFTTDMDALEANNDVRIGYYVSDGSAPPASTCRRRPTSSPGCWSKPLRAA